MNAKTPTETAPISSVTAELTPGKQLAAARQAKGLTLAQISHSTRILEYRLEAIERDDYSEVGGSSAFVIGYVKAFAAQVDVPSAPLIAALGVYFKQREVAQLSENPAPVRAKTINFGPWVASVLALVVFLGLGQWYITQQTSEIPAVVPSEYDIQHSQAMDNKNLSITGGAVAASSSGVVRTNNTTVKQEQPLPVLSDIDESQAHNLVVQQAAPDSAEPNNTATESITAKSIVATKMIPEAIVSEATESEAIGPEVTVSETIALRGGGNADVTDVTDTDSTAVNHTVTNKAATDNIQTPPASQGKDELALTFSGECWLEVFDAKGLRLVARLAKNSENITLKGQAPFDIKLGNAHFAKVKVNGREVELSLSPNRRVLRIQVGP